MNKIYIDGEHLSLENIVDVARNYFEVDIDNSVLPKIENSRNLVDKFVEEERVIYGITTGFGDLCKVVISKDKSETLQKKFNKKPCMWNRKAFRYRNSKSNNVAQS